jgi:hypothetical protein
MLTLQRDKLGAKNGIGIVQRLDTGMKYKCSKATIKEAEAWDWTSSTWHSD